MIETMMWPQKTRELQNHHLDSRVWNDFSFRNGDIIIATYPKAGTTWMQQIVGQLIFGGDLECDALAKSPWLDMRPSIPSKLSLLAAQTHRRFIKTHLPADALVISPKARYIYVARDGRDVVWSLHNHHRSHTRQFFELVNNTPGLVGPPFEPATPDIRQYWREWLYRDGYPYWSFWESVRTWWAIRNLSNVLLVHFSNLKRNLPSEIRRIATFLEIAIDESQWSAILEHCSFAWMKTNAAKLSPRAYVAFKGGGQTFFHRGINGRWSETLTSAEAAEYDVYSVHELGRECASWLASGESRR